MNPSAEEILESVVWKQATASVKCKLLEEFERTDPKDTISLVNIRLQLDALRYIIREVKRDLPKKSPNVRT